MRNPFARADKNERWLIASSFLNNMGIEAAYFVGFIGYAAYGFNATPTVIAFIMGMLNLSHMVGDALGGIAVDRAGPRRTTIITVLVTIAAAIAGQWTGSSLPAFTVFASVMGFCMSVMKTSYGSFAPYLERDRVGLKRVNSFVLTGSYTATVAGPAVAALITDHFPVLRIFLFAAVAAGLSALSVLPVKEKYHPHKRDGVSGRSPAYPGLDPGSIPDGAPTKKRPLQDALEGARIVFGSRSLRFYLLTGVLMWFAFGAFDALESLYYKDVLKVGVSWMGWMNMVTGAGLVVGVVALSRLPGRYASAKMLTVMLLVEGLGTTLYVGTHSVWWAMTGSLILGVAFGINEPLMRTLIQADSPLEFSGRILGTVSMVRTGMTLIPLAIAPVLARLLGTQGVLVMAGILTTVSSLLLIAESRRIDTAAAHIRKISQIDPLADADEANPREVLITTPDDPQLIYEE
jgi:MFS family permease